MLVVCIFLLYFIDFCSGSIAVQAQEADSKFFGVTEILSTILFSVKLPVASVCFFFFLLALYDVALQSCVAYFFAWSRGFWPYSLLQLLPIFQKIKIHILWLITQLHISFLHIAYLMLQSGLYPIYLYKLRSLFYLPRLKI